MNYGTRMVIPGVIPLCEKPNKAELKAIVKEDGSIEVSIKAKDNEALRELFTDVIGTLSPF